MILRALAIADQCMLISILLYIVFEAFASQSTQLYTLYRATRPYIVAFVSPIGYTSQTAITWIIMLGAIDRHTAVWKPLLSKTLCTYVKNNLKILDFATTHFRLISGILTRKINMII